MFIVFVSFIIFLVVRGYVVLDEESLIIIASFVWVDAAGGFIKGALNTELIQKGDLIKQKFFWFLNVKAEILTKLVYLHELRLNLTDSLIYFFEYVVGKSLFHLLSNFNSQLQGIQNNIRANAVFVKIVGISDAYTAQKLFNIFYLLKDSKSDVKNLSIVSKNISRGFALELPVVNIR